ncbi:hypothetical protein OG598_05365 [Micromonospora sp. NBC_00330]|uniref:hypothetical protein n=1 Tax=Micromonospora sp. NBC_00330 TaxID=2903585 RepID=UPI002E2B9179|nr:hypothetical protein [Micromonospora sp. NBC_00330]
MNSKVPVVGRVEAYDDHWRLGNLSDNCTLIVSDRGSPADLVVVRPGQVRAVIEFELADIATDADRGPLFAVSGPRPVRSWESLACPHWTTDMRPMVTSTVYFAVLLALCEPRLRYGHNVPLPTSSEVARRLTRLDMPLTPRAVDAQVDYLVTKLRVGRGDVPTYKRGQGWKKEAIVAAATAGGMVTPGSYDSRWSRGSVDPVQPDLVSQRVGGRPVQAAPMSRTESLGRNRRAR